MEKQQLVFGEYESDADDKTCRGIIENMIKEYQEKEYQDKYLEFKNESVIYDKICFYMTQVYNDNLLMMYRKDPYTFALVISTFFGLPFCLLKIKNDLAGTTQYNTDYLMITKAEYPLHTCLLLCYVSRTMQDLIEKRRDYVMVEKFDKLGRKWEESAVKIIKKLHETNAKYAIIALQIDYRQKLRENNTEAPNSPRECNLNCISYSDYIDAKYNQSRELMSIAYYAKAMEFLSQNACRSLLHKRQNTYQWVKLGVNCVFRMIYLILLAFLLIYGNPINGKKKQPEYIDELLRWSWYYIMGLFS